MSGISSVTDTTATGLTNGGTISSSSSSSSLTMDDFFTLLAAQLKYQDPTEGTDTSEYLGQMAQFGMLEQLKNLSTQYNYVLASNMLGKTVSYSSYDDTTGKTSTGSGTVSSVNLSSSTPLCQVGDKWVSLSDITGVSS